MAVTPKAKKPRSLEAVCTCACAALAACKLRIALSTTCNTAVVFARPCIAREDVDQKTKSPAHTVVAVWPGIVIFTPDEPAVS